MGRRRSTNKPPPKRKPIVPLDKVFNCPFCNHGRSCEVVLRRDNCVGYIKCNKQTQLDFISEMYSLVCRPVNIMTRRTIISTNYRLMSNVYYTKKHEWIKIDGNLGVVGITKYAEQKLGDIVYVELPVVGDKINANDQCAVVESVKAVGEVYSPASGTVVEVNTTVEKNTKIINKSPMDDGWLFKLQLSDVSQLKNLLSEENYNKFLTSES
ncbi:unnamed protein product [Trichobilharzia szidati]|nr:unnamed protein product [Trichobilharzia szidati]